MDLEQLFKSELQEQINECLTLSQKKGNRQALARILHTIKGNSFTAGYKSLGEYIHHLEDELQNERTIPWATALNAIYGFLEKKETIGSSKKPITFQVSSRSSDIMLDQIEAMLLHCNQLLHQNASLEVSSLINIIKDQYKVLINSRLVSVSRTLNRFKPIINQIASESGKEVQLKIVNDQTKIDMETLQQLEPLLVHLFTNAVVHGIEKTEIRKALGKNGKGLIQVNLKQTDGKTIVEISDDGQGFNQTEPGLEDKVTKYSGRKVGLKTVESGVIALGGKLSMETKRNEGTRFTISLPRRLTLGKYISVKIGDSTCACPVDDLEKIVNSVSSKTTEYKVGFTSVCSKGKNPAFIYLNTGGKYLTVNAYSKIFEGIERPASQFLIKHPQVRGVVIDPDNAPLPVINFNVSD
jgi:chemotaxis protein histidine kinase CheA